MAANTDRRRVAADYKVACICPMGVELAPVEAMLDDIHDPLPTRRDQNAYTLGHIGGHNIVIAIMPETGNNAAATVVTQLLNDFPTIRFGLLVGIGGGVPGLADVRLGDVVVSQATDTFGGVVQYDLGKRLGDSTFRRTGLLNKPPSVLSANVRKLQSQHRRQGHQLSQSVTAMLDKYPNMQLEYRQPTTEDRLFKTTYPHASNRNCEGCDVEQIVKRAPRSVQQPVIHYGTIGSANVVLKDAVLRDQLREDMNLLCVDMEAAGLTNDFPCLVIRGVCDYADSHKNKEWQPYAASVAAAYMKEILQVIPADQVVESRSAFETVQQETLQTTKFHLDRRQNHNASNGQQVINEQMSGMQDFNSASETVHNCSFRIPVGSCLGQAPSIQRDYFIGRDQELREMAEILLPGRAFEDQRRLVLGGMGGIGKTQLALAYARQHSQHYGSIFWLNATSEATIITSLHVVAKRVFTARDYHAIDTQHMLDYVNDWLSHPRNTDWLLIFDNYDEPQKYDIRSFFPNTTYGAAIITTRRPDLVGEQQVLVKPLKIVGEGLQILRTRSKRIDVEKDTGANRLAGRLAGLPLALATAGTFLRNSVWTFQQYLDAYEERWKISTQTPLVLPEYQNRTLYTTWELSYSRLREEEPNAAKLLQLFAYFDHQAIWYELLHAGADDNLPDWLIPLINSPAEFESIMRTLVDYCFIETQITTQTYSIHTCVHDWTISGLASVLQPWSYWYAFDCIAGSIKDDDWNLFGHVRYAKFTPHANSCMNARFKNIRSDFSKARMKAAEDVAELLRSQDQFSSASTLLVDVLTAKEEAHGPEHQSTLDIVHNLASLYAEQGKLAEAEQMYDRVLAGCEKALGPGHTSTLDTVHNLGLLYVNQGRLAEAEQMYDRALAGCEKASGPDHTSTLDTVRNLGNLYADQGKLVEAEQMYDRALAGREKALGPNHTLTLTTVHDLGKLYADQGKLVEAEQMYERVLVGYAKRLNKEHPDRLSQMLDYADLSTSQLELGKAKQMYQQIIDTCANCLAGTGSRSQSMADTYTIALSKMISIVDTTSSTDAQSYLCSLVDYLRQEKRISVIMIQYLAKALLHLRDNENVRQALFYCVVSTTGQKLDFGGTRCDACHRRLNTEMGMNVCRQCLDTNFCDLCLSEIQTQKLVVPRCQHEQFYDFGSTIRQALQSSESPSLDQMRTWLDKLEQQYRAF